MPKHLKTERKKKASVSPKKKKTKSSKIAKLTAKELKHFEKMLLEAREKERRQLSSIQEEMDRTQVESSSDLSAFPSHPADLGTDTSAREKNSILATVEGDILYEIDQALRKIFDKTYGSCETCEELISKKRLEAVPYARRCISCQEKVEKENLE